MEHVYISDPVKEVHDCLLPLLPNLHFPPNLRSDFCFCFLQALTQLGEWDFDVFAFSELTNGRPLVGSFLCMTFPFALIVVAVVRCR